MKKFFHKLHLWLSVPFGLIISVICLSGAALVFETEVMELGWPDRYFVQPEGRRPLDVATVVANVKRTLPDSVDVTSVNISSDPQRAWQMGLSTAHFASVYVDQYTGAVKWERKRAPFFNVMFRLHRWLLDSMKPGDSFFLGKTVVGVSTLLFVLVLISGIVIWIPKTVKGLRSRLKVSVGKGAKRFWIDLHAAGGIYTAIILLALALTGLTWSFPWYRTAFYGLFGAKIEQRGPGGGNRQGRDGRNAGGRPHDRGEAQKTIAYDRWQPVFDEISRRHPDYKQISITNGSASITFDALGNRRASDRYTFDPSTGRLGEFKPYAESDRAGKVRGWIASIHFGTWGGLFSKFITFFAALIGGILPLTGYYIWIDKAIAKRRAQAKAKSRRSA